MSGPDDGGAEAPDPGRWQRLLGWAQRPAPEGTPAGGVEEPGTVEELEVAIARADDKERLVGLVAAPLAGMIAVLVTSSLIANDPKATTATGVLNPHHVNPSLYLEVGAASLALAVIMLATAWFRKRLYLGIAMSLYGLSIFNLHFWGFGVPFLLGGAWYLVRAYRLQQKLKLARAGDTGSRGGTRPGANKRYTPPTRPPRAKPGDDERKAG